MAKQSNENKQIQVKKAENKKEKQTKAPQPKKQEVRLPILWETIHTFSRLMVTVLGISVALLSFMNGNTLFISVLRAGASMLVVGLLLWFLYWMTAKGTMDMMYELYHEQQQEKEQQTAVGTTVQMNG